MTRRLIWPLMFGLFGVAILVGLGLWQLQRLTWKEGVLAEIEARIAAPPVPLPKAADPVADRYLSVEVRGTMTEEEILVLASRKQIGPGYRLITAFETQEGRRIMIDRGFLPDAERGLPRPGGAATIAGNLHWPQETDSFTPPPDARAGLWFARDVPAMAAALKTEPLLIVLRTTSEENPPAMPMPVDSSSIPNDHLNYAITWFLLALVWAGMTGMLVWRITRRQG